MQKIQSRKYQILNEVLNAVTHGIGFGLSVAGLVILLIKGAHLGSPMHVVSYAVYGSMMILLFLFSTLFHSLIFTKAKKVFQVFDHCRQLHTLLSFKCQRLARLDLVRCYLGDGHWRHCLQVPYLTQKRNSLEDFHCYLYFHGLAVFGRWT